MSVDTLAFVVTKDHLLRFSLDCGDLHDFLSVGTRADGALLLASELFDTAAVDLEFVVAESTLVLGGILIIRHS